MIGKRLIYQKCRASPFLEEPSRLDAAYRKTGRKVVILIDEYDKPLSSGKHIII